MSTSVQVMVAIPLLVFALKAYVVVRHAEGPDDSLAQLWFAAASGGPLSDTPENRALAFLLVGALALL